MSLMGDTSIHAIIIMAITMIGSLFFFRFIMRKKRLNKQNKRIERIELEGVEFLAKETGLGFDPKMVRKDDGRMPCCLTTNWTNPETGKTQEIKSQWFWYNPRKEGDNLKFENIKGHVIPEDPTMCYMDISEYKLTTFLR
jgi:hypothetical protein